MRKHTAYMALICVLFACAKNSPEVHPDNGLLVRWSAETVGGYATKTLIETRELMECACTPSTMDYTHADGSTEKGWDQTVGVWSDYSINLDGTVQEVRDVFKGTTLIYNPESGSTDSKWEYKSNPAYWVIGGEYVFRAYYPAGELNVNSKLSSAKSLVIEMNTAKTQRDVLLAYNSFDTRTRTDAFGNIRELNEPVSLNFRHAMSCLMFRFKFYDGEEGVFYSEDALTSCWLQTDEDDSFALTGHLIYGDGKDYSEGLVNWRYQYYPESGLKFYHWTHRDGVTFTNVRNGETFDKDRDQTIATAFTGSSADGEVTVGTEFTRHNGWLGIIPQRSTGKVRLCFTTKSGGNAVFTVPIPKITGTAQEAYDAAPNDTASQKVADGDDFVPGWRYTYTVSISKTDADISLSIAPWKRLDSSFDIKFN